MGTGSKGTKREVNFRDAIQMLSQMQDQKFLQYAQEFTQTLTILTAKVEVLEALAKDKLGITQDELTELFFDHMDKMNGIPKNPDAVAASGDRVRIKFAQAFTAEEAATGQQEATIIVLGKGQVHANLDNAIIGLKSGDKFEAILPPSEAGGKDVFITGELRSVYSMPKTEATPNESEKTAAQ